MGLLVVMVMRVIVGVIVRVVMIMVMVMRVIVIVRVIVTVRVIVVVVVTVRVIVPGVMMLVMMGRRPSHRLLTASTDSAHNYSTSNSVTRISSPSESIH